MVRSKVSPLPLVNVNVFKLTDAVCIKLPVSPEPTLLILVAKEAEVISNAPDISDFNAAVELAAKEPVTAVNLVIAPALVTISASADVSDAAKEELATVNEPLISVFKANEPVVLLGTTLVATANELVPALIAAIPSLLAIILSANEADAILNEPDI